MSLVGEIVVREGNEDLNEDSGNDTDHDIVSWIFVE